MVVEVPLHTGERVRMPGVPMKFSDSPPPSFGEPPTLGRDTQSVLAELLGYDPARIAALREDRAIG